MAYLLAGPLVAIVGIVAVFFVLRRKSVDKRSMYSARRSQIEHKVRAARQRTMAPHGRSEKPSQPVPAAESPFAATQVQETATTWQAPAPRPAEPMAPAEPAAPAASATSAGAWSVVSTSKDGAVAEPESKKKDKGGAPASSWQLASGDAPGLEAEEPQGKRPAGTLMA